MFLQIILLIAGFVVLIKGADIFIDGASNTARNFKLSKALIGLTIVGLGTSAPEFAISSKAILTNNGNMVLGNVIGSNIMNILLILGICTIIKPIKVKSPTIRKEMPMVILTTSLFAILLVAQPIKSTFTRVDGLIIVNFLLVFIFYLLSVMKNNKEVEKPEYGLKKSITITILGIFGILFGSNLVVDSAEIIARYLNISDRVIALTVIALGTSLPELASGVAAVRKQENELLIGNIIGSNIYNIGLVLGLPVLLFGSINNIIIDYIDITVLLISTLLLFLFSVDKKISRKEGINMLLLFIAYYAYVIIKGVII